jgi:hypothetical protein
MTSLPRFREFMIWLNAESRPQITPATLKKLYRARARHKVATNFQGLRIYKGSTELVRGYSAGMRLFLSYSAAEAMGEAVEKHVAAWDIRDDLIASPLRRIAKPLPERHVVLSKKVRQHVAAFVAHEHDNVRVVATALRHLVAHGEFTPTGASVMTKVGVAAVSRLSDHLLSESERQFATWFTKIAES